MSQNNQPELGTPQTPVPPAGLEAVGSATYSPEDNKLRLYPFCRLSAETYERVRAAGFTWAAKQELFVAPAWTPARFDLLVQLCGEIEAESETLEERASARSERFDSYRERRLADAASAQRAVEAISSGIPLGQPILVGHHSERHARRDAQRIENGLRRAVAAWDTAAYWKGRAGGVRSHARYKAQPGVRARRIKKLEADLRRVQRSVERARTFLAAWAKIDAPSAKTGEPASAELQRERALFLANHAHVSQCFPLSEYPRSAPASQYEGPMGIWSALSEAIIGPEQARGICEEANRRAIAEGERWAQHYEHRRVYERELLEEQGAAALLEKPKRAPQLPLCNYRAPAGIECANPYYPGEVIHHPQIEMTQAEYARINKDYKGTRVVEHSHRVRTAMRQSALVSVFLTDAKVHAKPAARPGPAPRAPRLASGTERALEREPQVEAMREQLRAGVQVAVAPELYPTPEPLAERMAELAQIQRGDRMLEPSAGTGRLLDAARRRGAVTTAVELDLRLVDRLRLRFDDVRTADFLACRDLGTFDVVLMNPPFSGARDIDHILHALSMLRPGGRLVAICAGGPRQKAKLQPLVESRGGLWEPLPADTFREAGTSIHSVLLCVRASVLEAGAE